jgi:hypothetical protein
MSKNPFNYNYVFSEVDLARAKIKWWSYPLLWLKPTFVQCSEGYAWHFKRGRYGEIYLMKVEELPEIKEKFK